MEEPIDTRSQPIEAQLFIGIRDLHETKLTYAASCNANNATIDPWAGQTFTREFRMPPIMTFCSTPQEDGFTNAGKCSLDREGYLDLVTTIASEADKGLPPYGTNDSAEALLGEHLSRFLLVCESPNDLIERYSSEGLIAPSIWTLDSDLTGFNASSNSEIVRHYSSGAGTPREPINSDPHNLVSTHHQDLVIKKGS